VDTNTLGIEIAPNAWRSQVFHVLEAIQSSVFFQGWLYLLASLVALSLAMRRALDPDRLIACLALSSLANVLPYAIWGPTHHFRFLLWTIAAGLLSLLTLAARLYLPPTSASTAGSQAQNSTFAG
jgi:hypothetical protein